LQPFTVFGFYQNAQTLTGNTKNGRSD